MHAEMAFCGKKVWFTDGAASADAGGNIKLTVVVLTGKVTLPPTVTFCSVFHAAVTDQFSASWNVAAEETLKQEEG